MAERRRSFGPVVLVGLGAGVLTAVAGQRRAIEVAAGSESVSSSLLLTFDAQLPLVTALALVVLASWGVVLVTRGRVRRAVAGLGVLAAAGATVAGVAAYSQVADQLRDQLAQVGVVDPDLAHTGWYWLALVGAVLCLVTTVLAVLLVPGWPEMGSKYDAPGGGPAATGGGDPSPAEASNLDLWKAMDEGRDPTA